MTNPNQIIFILTDTQGANVIGCYGRSEMRTPNLDCLAAEGIRFDKAYTCQPVCGPARSAIFTGLYPHSNGVLGNDMSPVLDAKTIGQRLATNGVRTGYIGKWHLDGTDYFGNGLCPEGWDPEYWFDGRCYLDSLADDNERGLSREVLKSEDMEKHGLDENFTMAHRIVDRAIDFIKRYREEDFFLVVSIDEPHHPFICPKGFHAAFEGFDFQLGPNASDPLENKPQSQRDWSRHTGLFDSPETVHRNEPYFACNSYCDYEIGRVLQTIEDEIPDALTIYTSDHGDMLGAHRLKGKGPVMYDEIANIPFIVRWKGVAPEATVFKNPISHIDLVPTFLEFYGLECPEILQGDSLLPLFRDPGGYSRDAAFIEFNRFELDHDGFGAFSPIRCIVTERFKLALNLLDIDELYDLEADRGEMVNQIENPEYREIRDTLHDSIIVWQDRTRDPMRGPHWKNRSWRNQGSLSWGGPTRPRPFDGYNPHTLLYDTAEKIDKLVYDKH